MKLSNPAIKVIIISIALAYMESSVVVYLRKIYYPGADLFPIKMFDANIGLTELGRELATLIILACIGWMSGKNRAQRFAYILLAFAIWDIFYYVFLKMLIDWPASLFTWDILFLIPVTWDGPVLAPCIVSLNLIIFSASILYLDKKHYSETKPIISRRDSLITRIGFTLGSILILISFMKDYTSLLMKNGYLKDFWNLLSNKDFMNLITNYIPTKFDWWLFISGEVIWAFSLYFFFKVHGRRKTS